MKIQAHMAASHLRSTSPLARPQAPAEKASPLEQVELSSPPMEPVQIATPARADQNRLLHKVLGGLGLALVALSLVGCGGGTPGSNTNAGEQTQQNQNQQQTQATSYAQRLEQLRGQQDKTGYFQMAEAGFQRAILQRIANSSGPESKEIGELAQKGLEAFDFKADPATQQKLMREVMEAISKLPADNPGATRLTQAAASALQVGKSFADAASKAPGGIVAQVKVRGYEEALKAALEKLRQAPDTLKDKSGYDPALVRQYVESLSMAPEVVLEFAPTLGDNGLAAVLYEQVGDALYQRVKGDGQVLGGQVTAALELIQNLRKQFGF